MRTSCLRFLQPTWSTATNSMTNADYFIYLCHDIFWISFFVMRFFVRRREARKSQPSKPELFVSHEKSARFSRILVVLHGGGFFVMYGGIATALFGHRSVPYWFPGQRVAGAAIIFAGTVLTCSALFCFRSWRIRAKLDEGHQLTTIGPFRIIRHPIYAGFDLLALGSAVWIPTRIMWLAVIAMTIGGDLRARSEEILLRDVFGSAYREYCSRTKRFLPGLY